jgi:hypothetical protein
MQTMHKQLIAINALALTCAIGLQNVLQARSATQQPQAPMFEVDPYWPKPLPDKWILGSVAGIAIDARDHVYVVNLRNSFTARTEIGAGTNPPTGDCCMPAADVLEFDSSGVFVAGWGGPAVGYTWPGTPSGIAVDPAGNVWIGGSGASDTHILQFSADGRFMRNIGSVDSASAATAAAAAAAAARAAAADTTYAGVSRAGAAAAAGRTGGGRAAGFGGATGGRGRGRGGGGGGGGSGVPPNSSSRTAFGGVADISFDAAANEAFVADGYRNRRVAVLDIRSGAVRNFWGAYGRPPVDSDVPPAYSSGSAPAQQFRTPVHCAEPSSDGMVYVCDRASNRIQVFRKDGTYVREKVLFPATLGGGAVWDIAFSRDPQQRFLYVADGMNMKVHILDRQSLDHLTSFGDGGRQPGAFLQPRGIATDSRGNIYTVEGSEGKRIQKFVFKGIGPVTTRDQGILWPK